MPKNKVGAHIRAEAAKTVHAVISNGRSLDAALSNSEKKSKTVDHSLLRLLCYGTLRYYFRLRGQLNFLLTRPLKAKDRVIESLLLVGMFQITDTRVPNHAAVSSAVEAARILGKPQYTKLVNGVLRNYVRHGIRDKDPEDPEGQLNHPQWLIERLRRDWPDDWLEIIGANDARAPMWLRINRTKAPTVEYLNRNSIKGKVLRGFDQAIRLDKPMPVNVLPGFLEGHVSVQDAAAQLAGPWLIGDGGKFILDACAAPGGKTGHLLEIMRSGGALTAVDSDPNRIVKVEETAARLGRDATIVVADSARSSEWWDGRYFDRILLDAPCSATGVIRRHPDIKILRRDDDIAVLAAKQLKMLKELWVTLEPGGRLLYVTCSVLSEENEEVVQIFLDKHDDAKENRLLPNNNIRALMRKRQVGYQILPGTEDVDGFYYACLEKLCSKTNERHV
ncbi:MAG: 16S rRNA (cytosine(967)-C(5))-methyltransferase [Woeseia sp.]|nr:16S rRNA (cytosine(967)-C(5))-methyltransferase [Woeseia sp.]|tara:strand:- start:1475 stop:2818 length:1344 start_codon:yes stop_codon:yes gene_type:complete